MPMVSTDTIKIDFLHTADLGTTPDFLANLFYDITMYKIHGPGLSKHESRCDEFFKSYILPYYKTNNIDSRLPCLRPSMLKKENNKQTFKLRAKAGEARRLVPLVPYLVHTFFKPDEPYGRMVIAAGESLHQLYACLSHQHWCLVTQV